MSDGFDQPFRSVSSRFAGQSFGGESCEPPQRESPILNTNFALPAIMRSYQLKCTRTHRHPEVKSAWAGSVLSMGTRREAPVTHGFAAARFFFRLLVAALMDRRESRLQLTLRDLLVLPPTHLPVRACTQGAVTYRSSQARRRARMHETVACEWVCAVLRFPSGPCGLLRGA